MGLPGHRRTSSHKRRRAAHFALKMKSLTTCAKCGAANMPHRVCEKCGSYNGRQVVDMARTAGRLIKKASATAKASEDTSGEKQAPAAPAKEKKAKKPSEKK